MRNTFILSTIILFLTFINLNAQQVEKKFVLLEIATGTWCYYCPAAANGAEDLIENGKNVAILEHHNGDDYANAASNTRNSYYSPSGIPSAYFDGEYSGCSGGHTGSKYSCYLPIYENAIAELSSFDVQLEVSTIDDINFDVTLTIDKVADYTGSDIRAHIAVTESHIEENWQGLDMLHWVTRDMYPSASGTTLDFSGTDQIVIEHSFQADSEWNIENCEIVGFVQNHSTKEVMNADKLSLNLPNGTNNVMVQQITSPNEEDVCGSTISPEFMLKNKGSENLTAVEISYQINGESSATFNWTGNLAFGESELVSLDPISFTPQEANTLTITANNPNGVSDENPDDNSLSHQFQKSYESFNALTLDMNPGVWAFEISWEITDASGNIIAQGSGYDNSEEITETIEGLDLSCHRFTIYDSYGNGFNSDDGYCTLTDANGNVFFDLSGNFGDSAHKNFLVSATASNNTAIINEFHVYPNPAKDKLSISFPGTEADVIITELSGRLVHKYNKVSESSEIDISNLSSGIYFVRICAGEQTVSRKISVK